MHLCRVSPGRWLKPRVLGGEDVLSTPGGLGSVDSLCALCVAVPGTKGAREDQQWARKRSPRGPAPRVGGPRVAPVEPFPRNQMYQCGIGVHIHAGVGCRCPSELTSWLSPSSAWTLTLLSLVVPERGQRLFLLGSKMSGRKDHSRSLHVCSVPVAQSRQGAVLGSPCPSTVWLSPARAQCPGSGDCVRLWPLTGRDVCPVAKASGKCPACPP